MIDNEEESADWIPRNWMAELMAEHAATVRRMARRVRQGRDIWTGKRTAEAMALLQHMIDNDLIQPSGAPTTSGRCGAA